MTTGLLDDAVVAFTDAWDTSADPHLHVTGPHRTGRTQGLIRLLLSWQQHGGVVLCPDPHTTDASGLHQAFLIVADAINILHARARNREDEPDATFPPVLVILDDYDRILRLAEDATQLEQLRRNVRHLIHEGARDGVHLALATSTPHPVIEDEIARELSTVVLGDTASPGDHLCAGMGTFTDRTTRVQRIRF